MARFLHWSDLHNEFEAFAFPKPDDIEGEIDAILVAGDTDVKGRHVAFLEAIWDAWRVPVLAVPGNHEPYGSKNFQKHLKAEIENVAEARGRGVDIEILRGASRVIGDTRVLGCTLWTDMALWGDPVMSSMVAQSNMNDYRKIGWHDERRGIWRKMIPQDTTEMHWRERQWLLTELAVPHDGPTVVMTHHVPVVEQVHKSLRANRDPISAAYASDLWPAIEPHAVSAWISGHTHHNIELRLDGTHGPVAFLANARGYPHQDTGFDPCRVLDSQAPRLAAELGGLTAPDEPDL